jgi:hypothetical protein
MFFVRFYGGISGEFSGNFEHFNHNSRDFVGGLADGQKSVKNHQF